MLTTHVSDTNNPLRQAITHAYRTDETTCVDHLLSYISLNDQDFQHIKEIATTIVTQIRQHPKHNNKIDALLHQYDLSTNEGVALMCLAEALLRIPDTATQDKLIGDKLSTVNWKNHLNKDNSFFLNLTTWSLLLTGKCYQPLLNEQDTWFNTLKQAMSRLGGHMIRPFIFQMMKTMGEHFVLGQDIHTALKRATQFTNPHYRFSYDMLGEAARTTADAKRYYETYCNAIEAIGRTAQTTHPMQNPGISVKLSALHPRYEFAKREHVLQTLPSLLLTLATKAKQYHMGLTIDAEEADRLDLSLDIIEQVFSDPALNGWEGFGLAVQAYQKRAFYVIDWLVALTKKHHKRLMVRLVKGAYWDAEIKATQVQGLAHYPVFTRKYSTDVSYIACAQKLFTHAEYFYLQFGTHNAYTVASLLTLAKQHPEALFEFQGLCGMGRALYEQITDPAQYDQSCRIYAPVGVHQDLLCYLVRRLLENGTNTAFINRLADQTIPIDAIVANPVTRVASLTQKPHPAIPLPKMIYAHWQNSEGIDLSNYQTQASLNTQVEKAAKEKWTAHSIVNGQLSKNHATTLRFSPANTKKMIGETSHADEAAIQQALLIAEKARTTWGMTSVETRAQILEKAAECFQEAMPKLITLLTLEGGRCLTDCISEVREAIDFCRYYAYRARHDLAPQWLPGPTGETNQLTLHPRGPILCISPWNFPLAIFTGQIVAALVAGNPVIAKPAEQTPLIAFQAIQILREAGVPDDALQLLLGKGSVIGPKIISDPRLAGVMLTGSTETAKQIERTLAGRNGPIGLLIAETGGQNAMIVDSSALPEQVVIDVIQSAFNSAGQRCSALRVLFLQEDIADKTLALLKGAMAELEINDPSLLSTDIGPVIDEKALNGLKTHYNRMKQEAKLVAEAPLAPLQPGYYFAPCVFEIPTLTLLQGEVFGPILHVIRYRAEALDNVIAAISNTGYGLTLGIHSRVEATQQYIIKRAAVGNIYVNRNMIGAVVGVQPFGGERLSGTGPKAGGPHYLLRLCVEHVTSINTTAVGGNTGLISLGDE